MKTTTMSARNAPTPTPPSTDPARAPRSRHRLRDWLATLPMALLLPALLLPISGTAAATGGTLIINQSELSTRPTSGAAWDALVEVARGSYGTPDLTDQDSQHGVRLFAGALVAARLDDSALRTRVRDGIMAAIGTERVGAGNSTLALGRQLSAYVMAADVIDLAGSDDATFRSWLSAIRTKVLGGHSTWDSLVRTHESSANNWGAFAGASRIAASLYLGDAADVDRAAKVLRGFLGERAAYAGFRDFDSDALSWACSVSGATPINPACMKSGIDVDGAIIEDVARGGSLRWPPGDSGQSYTLESLQGLTLQAELLSRAGYPAWDWSSQALKRAARLVTRFSGWNRSSVDRHVPWLLNKRYGLGLPTDAAGMGRGFGFTDWLYGPAGSGPPPTPGPTVVPTATASPRPTSTPTPQSTPTPPPGPAVEQPLAPTVAFVTTTSVRTTSVPLVVRWGPAGQVYQVQERVNDANYTTVTTGPIVRVTRAARSGFEYRYRVRARDGDDWTDWASGKAVDVVRIGERSQGITYTGRWRSASGSGYIGGKVKYATARGAKASLAFTGRSVALIGPKGPTRGRAKIYLDGAYVRTINLYRATYRARQIVFAYNWPEAGTHRLSVVVSGSAGRPMVAIDAIYIMK